MGSCGETWAGMCKGGGKGWVAPRGKATAVGMKSFGLAQAEVKQAVSPGTGNGSQVLWGRAGLGRQIPSTGEGGAHFPKAAPAGTSPSPYSDTQDFPLQISVPSL